MVRLHKGNKAGTPQNKANVDYLITTDKQMMRAGRKSDTKIKIINPIELIVGA